MRMAMEWVPVVQDLGAAHEQEVLPAVHVLDVRGQRLVEEAYSDYSIPYSGGYLQLQWQPWRGVQLSTATPAGLE